MIELTTDLLPKEKWEKMRRKLKYFYLIEKDFPCCYYEEGEEQIAILYNSKMSQLLLITKDEPHCRDFLNGLSSNSFSKEEIRDRLICPEGMKLIVDEYYHNNRIL